MTTAAFVPATDNRNPDHARGRADAYDEHAAGTPLGTLEDRLEWMTDPRVARTLNQLVPAAYLDGYRSYIQSERAAQHAEYLAYLADRTAVRT